MRASGSVLDVAQFIAGIAIRNDGTIDLHRMHPASEHVEFWIFGPEGSSGPRDLQAIRHSIFEAMDKHITSRQPGFFAATNWALGLK
jgi:hypothetical protein